MDFLYRTKLYFYIDVTFSFIERLTSVSGAGIAFLTGCLLLNSPLCAQSQSAPLTAALEPIRAKYNLPALGGAIFTTDGLVEMAAVGVRKAGTTVPVTADDLWHLGSDTKMMTATLAGTFVAEKKLSWSDTVISFFPEISHQVPGTMLSVTLSQILRHEGGIDENFDWGALAAKGGTLQEQRLAAAKMALTQPAHAPGTSHYSNTDYVIVAAILEKISGKPWEQLIQERVFQPLGMHSVGFGGSGTVGLIDQPWGHDSKGVPSPINGTAADNPLVMAPAGCVHCSMSDWAKFLTDQLRGGSGMKALLPNDIYDAMQTAIDEHNAGYGWGIADSPWAGGKMLWHNGSNGTNYSICWLSPEKKVGFLVCTNACNSLIGNATDDAMAVMLNRWQTGSKAKP